MSSKLFLRTVLGLGIAFLYLPMIVLIVFSFNASEKVNIWGGFSTKWYGALLQDTQLIEAAVNSLTIATVSATFATVIGTLGAISLVRFGRFRGRTLLSGMMSAPLVMPEVITGISLLLLFVAMEQLLGWPSGRGMTTITIAHVTFCSAFVVVIVQSRLVSLDRDLEEAAADLGSPPFRVFQRVVLPLIAPALAAGWLLAFTLSLDDLVIASFTTGPGATTLPTLIFSKVRLGVSPDVNALATIIVLAVGFAVAVAAAVMFRTSRRQD